MLRLVVARVGRGKVDLEDAHAHRLPAGLDADDPTAMGGFIAESLKRHNLKHRRVVVDVPRDRAVINRLRLPPTPLNELAAAVRFQAMRELPFSLEEAEIDYVVMNREGALATEVLLAAVRREVLERVRQTCAAAHLTPVRIGLRPYANLVAVSQLPATLERRTLFVDVGPTGTEIDVLRGRVLAFSRSAQVNAPLLGEDAGDRTIPISAKAEQAEIELAESNEQAIVDELLVEVTRSLQAYRATETNAGLDQIVVAGGTGLEPALLEALEKKFNLPTMLFDPTAVLGVRPEEAVKLRAFSAALGLAWGLSRDGLLELDFLNPKKPQPPRADLYRRLRIGGIAAAVLILSVTTWLISDTWSMSSQLERLRKQNNERQARLQEITRLDMRARAAGDWNEQSHRGVWLDHILRLTDSAVDIGKKMLLTDIVCDADSATITVKLAADSWDTVAEYIDNLEQLEESGKKIYHLRAGIWNVSRNPDAKFRGTVDLRVQIEPLAAFVRDTPKRDGDADAAIKAVP